MRVLSQDQTRQHLPFDLLVEALDQAFREGCEVPLRHNHPIGEAGAQGGILLLMPAWRVGGRLGVKTVSIFPGNQAHGLPGLHSVFILYDACTGVPLAILDGDVITSRRTVAASALAARFLSRPQASRLLVVGAGRVASLVPEAYRAVRPIEQVQVWDRHPEKARALAQQLRAQGIAAQGVEDLAQAASSADIISCATLATAPLIRGEWLQPGTHLDLIGSFTPEMRETDDACLQRSRVFIDTEEALMKAGDLLAPIKAGAFHADQVVATLQQLCRGERPGRQDAEQITLFKSVGTALEDLAAACLAYDAFLGQADRD